MCALKLKSVALIQICSSDAYTSNSVFRFSMNAQYYIHKLDKRFNYCNLQHRISRLLKPAYTVHKGDISHTILNFSITKHSMVGFGI